MNTESGRWRGTKELTFAHPRIVLAAPGGRAVQVIEQGLRQAGAVVEVVDLEVPVAFVAAFEPDVIVVDVVVDAARGTDVDLRVPGRPLLGSLRGGRGPGAPPVVALVDDPSAAARDALLDAGADDVVRKPFDLAELFVRLDNLLRVRQLDLPGSDAAGRREAARRIAEVRRRLQILARRPGAEPFVPEIEAVVGELAAVDETLRVAGAEPDGPPNDDRA